MMYTIVSEWDNGIVEKIQRYENVYIYGAGDWGRRFYIWCSRNNMKISAVIVTSADKNPDTVFGCAVKTIGCIENEIMKEKSLTIVAAEGKVGKQIYAELEEKKITEVWLISRLPLLVEGDNYFATLDKAEYPYAISRWFYQDGHYLDLDNVVTFNEKIQWLKVYGDCKLMSSLADKYLVREWVKECIGDKYLIGLLGKWDKFDEIDFDSLPNQFVLKCNHGCGYNIVVKDKKLFDISDAREKINDWMNEDFGIMGAFESHYSLIQRKIIAEEYIEQSNGGLYDYKVHCFNGKPRFIQLIGERNAEKHEGRQFVFDTEWNQQDWTFGDYPRFTHSIPKPQCLTELLDVAEKLSQGICYVRVDLYVLEGDNIKFGEMTFTPAGGTYSYNTDWTKNVNLMLGNLIQLPDKSFN